MTTRAPPLRATNGSLSRTPFKDRPVKLLSLYSILSEVGAAVYENFLILGEDTSTRTYQRIGLGTGILQTLREVQPPLKADDPFLWLSQYTVSTHARSRYHRDEICIS